MLDLLPSKLEVLAFVWNAWTGLSLTGLSSTVVGVAIIAFAALAPFWFPGRLRWPLAALGAALAMYGWVYQSGIREGVRASEAAQHRIAVAAESERADEAEIIKNRIAAQAASDLAALRAANLKLKGLNDALRTDPHRDRECLDRGLARRLRSL